MPHADSSLVPESIQTKAAFWDHIYTQLESLFEDQKYWVSNLANAASLIYTSLLAFPKFYGPEPGHAVNWAGFYIHASLFPTPKYSTTQGSSDQDLLLLGPFSGKPACQFIRIAPGKARGVCADAFLQKKTVVVPEVDLYPGHIACDGETKSEIVVPLVGQFNGLTQVLGVLDLDCLAVNGFDDEDRIGLERIVRLIVGACEW